MAYVYSTTEAAERAGCTRQTIALHCRTGAIDAKRHGPDWAIDADEFQKWLKRRRRPGWEKGRPRKIPLTEAEKRAARTAAESNTIPTP